MSKKMIKPTDAMVLDLKFARALVAKDTVGALRAALNHPHARKLFECDHTDYVHVDEAATRVEAAREQGWDDAAQHIYNKGWEGVTALRKANPHRPALELPTEDGAVIVPADGHEYIEAKVGDRTYITREAVVCQSAFGPANVLEGAWRRVEDGWRVGGQMGRDFITPGTWKAEGE